MRPYAFVSAVLLPALLATPLTARAEQGTAAEDRRGWFFAVSALLVGGGGSLKLHPSSLYGEASGSSPEKTVEPFLGPGVELTVGHAVVPDLALALDGTLFAGAVTSDSPNFVPNPHTSGVQGERVLVTAEWFALPHLGFRLGADVESYLPVTGTLRVGMTYF